MTYYKIQNYVTHSSNEGNTVFADGTVLSGLSKSTSCSSSCGKSKPDGKSSGDSDSCSGSSSTAHYNLQYAHMATIYYYISGSEGGNHGSGSYSGTVRCYLYTAKNGCIWSSSGSSSSAFVVNLYNLRKQGYDLSDAYFTSSLSGSTGCSAETDHWDWSASASVSVSIGNPTINTIITETCAWEDE